MKKNLFLLMLAMGLCSTSLFAQSSRLKTEKNGYQWYEISNDDYYGVKDKSGKILIPLERGYSDVTFIPNQVITGYFSVEKDDKEGACDLTGKELISPDRGYEDVTYIAEKALNGYFSVEKGGHEGVCDKNGKELISPDRGYDSVTFLDEDGVIGYFLVEKDGHEGACDIHGKEIIAPTTFGVGYDEGFEIKKTKDGRYAAIGITLNSEGIASSYGYGPATTKVQK